MISLLHLWDYSESFLGAFAEFEILIIWATSCMLGSVIFLMLLKRTLIFETVALNFKQQKQFVFLEILNLIYYFVGLCNAWWGEIVED